MSPRAKTSQKKNKASGNRALDEFTSVKWISVQNEARQYPFS
jgi:hypothetical protein